MTSTRLSSFGPLALLVVCGSGSPPMEADGQIARVATLHSARAAHTATTLRSGLVLIAGGMADGGGSLASVERFDPSRNTLQELASLDEARSGHTATLLADGRVLIAGGFHGGEYLRSVVVFDPVTNHFEPAGTLLEGRSGHTATLLPDGRVLFVGGVGRDWTFLRSAERYDPTTGRSEPVGPMSVPRESHTSTLLADGRVLVVGGHSGRREAMNVYASAELFSTETGRFEPAGTLGTPRHKHDAVRLADGRVLVIGGADRTDRTHFATTEVYDPGTRVFEHAPEMSQRRYKIAGTAVLLPDGNVLVPSGARVAELLDVRDWIFRDVPGAFPDAYRFAAVAPLADGDVVVIGGYSDGNENTAGVWRYRRS